jgi:hypothetical protein
MDPSPDDADAALSPVFALADRYIDRSAALDPILATSLG